VHGWYRILSFNVKARGTYSYRCAAMTSAFRAESDAAKLKCNVNAFVTTLPNAGSAGAPPLVAGH
jgi:hypothetical protein